MSKRTAVREKTVNGARPIS